MPPIKCRKDAHDRVGAGSQIADRNARAHGAPVLLSRQAHAAGQRLHDHVVGRLVAIRAVLAETADRGIDDTRIELGDAIVVDAVFGGPARPHVLDNNIAVGGEAAHQLLPFLCPQVDRDALLVAVDRVEIGAVGPDEVGRQASRIVAGDLLDLDHLRAEVAQNLGRERTRQERRQIEHLDVAENAFGLGHSAAPFTRVSIRLD